MKEMLFLVMCSSLEISDCGLLLERMLYSVLTLDHGMER